MVKHSISSSFKLEPLKRLYLPLVSARKLGEGQSASCRWSLQTGRMVGHHFLQLAEGTELLHEQLQFYLFQALQKCTCTYKRKKPHLFSSLRKMVTLLGLMSLNSWALRPASNTTPLSLQAIPYISVTLFANWDTEHIGGSWGLLLLLKQLTT